MSLDRSDRIYVRIEPKLKRRVQRYCKKNSTNISDVVNRFFMKLLDAAEKREREAEEPRQI
jgi:hypothetical protein